jgi:4'-phosphopantetheinyl transferase
LSDAYTISEGEVHIWTADCDAIDYEPMWGLLDVEEVNRAKRFREPRDSRRYVVSHGVMRSILSKYMNEKPKFIKYERGYYGKPGIAGGSWLRFNMSHSNGMAAYAIASGQDVGIDLEYMREIPFMELSRSVLSTNEDAYLRSVPVKERLNVFYMFWTRKEAYIKAIGEGLYMQLSDVDVSSNDKWNKLSYNGSMWSITDVVFHAGYACAIAVHGEVRDIKTFTWL